MITTCDECGFTYAPDEPGDKRLHNNFHRKMEAATKHFNCRIMPLREREELKLSQDSGHALAASRRPLQERVEGALQVCRAWFSRSVEGAINSNWNWKKHPHFHKYVAMLLSHKPSFPSDVVEYLRKDYGTIDGEIPNGSSDWEPKTLLS